MCCYSTHLLCNKKGRVIDMISALVVSFALFSTKFRMRSKFYLIKSLTLFYASGCFISKNSLVGSCFERKKRNLNERIYEILSFSTHLCSVKSDNWLLRQWFLMPCGNIWRFQKQWASSSIFNLIDSILCLLIDIRDKYYFMGKIITIYGLLYG